VRIWAVGASFDAKDALKSRRYRWNSGDDKRPKAWYRDVREDEQAAEQKWLADVI
jgi:DNA polymerase-3 subunit epsilon